MKQMHRYILLFIGILLPVLVQAQATVTETMQSMKTYPFSDPDPVANPSTLFYPYFRFDGFAAKGVDQDWKVVELENDYIKVSLFPEVGGKIWGAVDKTSQKEFIYYNHVVKFRDIAMRGAWTSGGIEFNFGIIGHVPSTATPVDYLIKKKEDGSASCYVSSYEWVTRTWWTVEVNLEPDKAYFTTNTTWHNSSSIDQPYYQWMNAGYKAAGNPQFIYPGTNYIGHGGELHTFPLDEKGNDISWYDNHTFGGSRSYHVMGHYNDFYATYWHDDDFGSVHHAEYNDKLGMKIFLWGLARSGAIWEDLLTDNDGQYIELQSGRMYNQPSSGSANTPFKHTAFAPQATDSWTEFWYPVNNTKGISKAAKIGALHVVREEGRLKLYFSPLEKLSTSLKIYNGEKLVETLPLQADVLNTWEKAVNTTIPEGDLRIVIGDDALVHSEVMEDNVINRPKVLPADFDHQSVYGLYLTGQQWMYQKEYVRAERFLHEAIAKDPYYIPALSCLASLYYRQGHYEEALSQCLTGLSINTYDGDLNYIYGLVNKALGQYTDAKDGFSVATYSTSHRSAAYAQLSMMYMLEKNWKKAEEYALRSLDYNTMNLNAYQALVVTLRKTGQTNKAVELANKLAGELPLWHLNRFELALLGKQDVQEFTSLIRNELPFENYMEMALWYEGAGCLDEAIQLLGLAGDYPVANYKQAFLLHKMNREEEALALLEKANAQSPQLVFPFRAETMEALEWAASQKPDWKIVYYQGLIWWANQDKEKALALFDSLEDVPFAPFYLSRATLKSGEAMLADLLQAEKTERSWRTGFALINYYYAVSQWEKVAEVGKKYMRWYPENYYIGLKYAKALSETGKYSASIALLDRMTVLPNEGSRIGRIVYKEANLYQAMDFLKRGNKKRALSSIILSKEWPENLGVGKPYTVDDRLENYLEAQLWDGKQKEELLQQVVAYAPANNRFNSLNLITALSLRELGKTADADNMVASWTKGQGANSIVQWCTAIYKGDKAKAAELLRGRNNTDDTATPWETSYQDTNLDLLIKLLQ